MEKDLIVIGGGPGGYVAAIIADQLGAKVTLVEEDQVGGTCLNRGCIPTKALYKNAQIIHTLQKSAEFGIELKEYALDMKKVRERKQDVVNRLGSGISQLLKGNGVEVIKGKEAWRKKTPWQLQLLMAAETWCKGETFLLPPDRYRPEFL